MNPQVQHAAKPYTQKSALRTLGIALPAGLITICLFMRMEQMIAVDDFSPPAQRVYELTPYLEPLLPETEPRIELKIVRADPIAPPPRPPALIKSLNHPDLSDYGYSGAAPADYGAASLEQIKPATVASMIDRVPTPLTPPMPRYPNSAETRGISGTCDVHFNLTPRGDAYDVRADCTDRVFKSAAEKAVKRVKFAPKIRDGVPITVTGAVYPIEFRIEP